MVLLEKKGGFEKWLQKWRYEMLTKASANYERLVPGGMCQNGTKQYCSPLTSYNKVHSKCFSA